MGYNVSPAIETDNVSFGPGVLYAGTECGTCPSVDIGAVRSGAELVITREKITLEQGSPYQRITDYVIRETITLTVTGVEWNFENLQKALGAGITGGVGADQRFRFGGSMGMCSISICFRHHTAEGDEIYAKLWCAQGNGEITITFGDDIHEFPYGFTAIQGSRRGSPSCLRAWSNDPHDANGILGDGEHLFEIYRETNPEITDPCA